MHFPSLAELIVEKSGFSGNLGMILGSGLSSISNELTNTIEIPYQDLNGFPISTVLGHDGKIVVGYLEDIPVIIASGRFHYYEGYSFQEVVSLIKVFSSFFFANQDTKTPFYISLISVILNIIISVYYFSEIGFIIIPIATSISSWFNSLLLFIFLKNRNLFNFNKIFVVRFVKIIIVSLLMNNLAHLTSMEANHEIIC